MAWLQSTYTIRLNSRHQLIGYVLSGRYQAQWVGGSGKGYLRAACDYVHPNRVRAGQGCAGGALLQLNADEGLTVRQQRGLSGDDIEIAVDAGVVEPQAVESSVLLERGGIGSDTGEAPAG